MRNVEERNRKGWRGVKTEQSVVNSFVKIKKKERTREFPTFRSETGGRLCSVQVRAGDREGCDLI